jgi:flavin reductase (DIM6/NTAB) family NADH-FMN oxidoreductase RutF
MFSADHITAMPKVAAEWPVFCVSGTPKSKSGIGAMHAADKLDEGVGADFRATRRRFPATVTVVTASDGVRDHGMTVTAVSSVSMSPPSLMVCLNNRTLLHEMLLSQANFAVNVLSDVHPSVSDAFSGKVEPGERFATGGWERDPAGMMILPSAHAIVICRRMAAVPHGTHTIFIGQVTRARGNSQTWPLLYAEASYCTSQRSS